MKLARELARIYKELLTLLDEARERHGGSDYYEKLIDALDSIGSAMTRMRARGILDPETERELERVLEESVLRG